MRWLFLGIIFIYLLLAIISRENGSKYKDKSMSSGVAEWILLHVPSRYMHEKIKTYLRKCHPGSVHKLEELAFQQEVQIYSLSLRILVVGSLILFASSFLFLKKEPGRYIERGQPGSMEMEYSIDLKSDEEQETITFTVFPMEYTEEEFQELSDCAKANLDQVLPGNNENLNTVKQDLVFPTEDETGTLQISWRTDEPFLLDRAGKIHPDEITKPVQTRVDAFVTDGTHERDFRWEVTLLPEEKDDKKIAIAGLEAMEEKTRTESRVEIPEQIGKIRVSVHEESAENKLMEIFVLVLCVAGISIALRVEHLKDAGEKRDDQMEIQYFGIINQLVLNIGAGMTVRGALSRIAERKLSGCEPMEGLIYAEIKILCNKIESGVDEATAYAELGNSIGIRSYTRLFSILSQNLNHGNDNLLQILETEEATAIHEKKELAKKKGEEASTKLLAPMFILLVIVMGIVLFPAVISL